MFIFEDTVQTYRIMCYPRKVNVLDTFQPSEDGKHRINGTLHIISAKGQRDAVGGVSVCTQLKQSEERRSKFKLAVSFSLMFFFKKKSHHDFLTILFISVRNRAIYLPEWIEYHRLLGVDHFIFFDNFSSDKIHEYLSEYQQEGIATVVNFNVPTIP